MSACASRKDGTPLAISERVLLAAARYAMGYGRVPLRMGPPAPEQQPLPFVDRANTVRSSGSTPQRPTGVLSRLDTTPLSVRPSRAVSDRVRLAEARFEMWRCRRQPVTRYGGHDVSNQPRDKIGRWTEGGGEGKLKQIGSSNDPVRLPTAPRAKETLGTREPPPGAFGAVRPDVGLRDNQRQPELTLDEKKIRWAKQAEMGRLRGGIQNFEKDLRNPNLSPGHRASLQRALAECRQDLTKRIVEQSGFAPLGNLARGHDPVATMSLMRKFEAAIRKAISSGQLSADVRTKLEELLEPENLAMMATVIGGYAVLHATPLAPGLAVADAYMLGSGAAETGNALFQAYLDLESATTPQELEQASKALSKLLTGPIVDAMLKAVTVGASRGASAFHKRYKVTVKVDPNTLGMNLGNVKLKVTKREAVPNSGLYRGGRHGNTKKPVGDGLESHHIPAHSVNGLPIDNGPAIQMHPADHAMTASHGGRRGHQAYRVKQQNLIKRGRFGEAIQMDIDDIRKKFPDGRYEEAIQEMIDSLDPWMKKGLKG